jgi:hypothetical protein
MSVTPSPTKAEEAKERTMSKAIYCALAMMIGAAIGATAPQEWRNDSDRYAAIATSADPEQSMTMALVFRPHQGD